jgi:hypothetical protein
MRRRYAYCGPKNGQSKGKESEDEHSRARGCANVGEECGLFMPARLEWGETALHDERRVQAEDVCESRDAAATEDRFKSSDQKYVR